MSKRNHKGKRLRAKKSLIVSRDGPACPRCGVATVVMGHRVVTAKLLRQPYYYYRWHRCVNLSCRTTQIMPEEFRVWRPHEVWDDKQPGAQP
jgi:ribosomal protein S27AE